MAKLDIEAALADHSGVAGGDSRKSVGRSPLSAEEAISTATSRASGAALPSPVQGFVTAMQGPLFGFLDTMTGSA